MALDKKFDMEALHRNEITGETERYPGDATCVQLKEQYDRQMKEIRRKRRYQQTNGGDSGQSSAVDLNELKGGLAKINKDTIVNEFI